jgi:nucleoside-diphosphate-sugar epimerase
MRAEREIVVLADEDFSPCFLRNATAYGLSPMLRFDLVVNNLVAWALSTGRIYLKSDGTPWRPLVHVADIAHAFVVMLDAPREVIHNEVFNVGVTAHNYQIRDIAEAVAGAIPIAQIEYAPDAGPDKRSYRVDFGKIQQQVPAFSPAWDLERGVQELCAACQKRDLSPEAFEGPQYARVVQLRALMAEGKIDAELRWV